MATRESALQRGRRLARNLRRRIGEQIRQARMAAGLSQRELGRLIGRSHQTIGRIERGEVPNLTVDSFSQVAVVLGLDVSLGLHPSGSPVRDAAHLALLDRLRVRLGPDRRLRVEVPMPIAGDHRSVDAYLREVTFDVMFEAETRVDDLQALIRRIRIKQRDLGCTRVVLLLSDTRHHRDLIRVHPELREEFPVPPRRGIRALAAGVDPGGDVLILL
jgi:HTH-type transcriptional regulator / antitoxin HipB